MFPFLNMQFLTILHVKRILLADNSLYDCQKLGFYTNIKVGFNQFL